jgi:tRNA-modifying protein YgfZ
MPDTTHSPAAQPTPLDRAELIEIAGADAVPFAHAQFSSDVAALATGAWQYSAWLTAQGRVHRVFTLLRIADDRVLLWLPLGGARAMRDALARYVFRAKVRIDLLENWALWQLVDAVASDASRVQARDGGWAFAIPGATVRIAWLGPSADTAFDVAARDAWRLADIAAGLPWIAPATEDSFVPQALDLARIDAIRFDKGCFPGQEIAARLHFRGGVKQRLRRIALRGSGEVLPGIRIEGATGGGIVLYGSALAGDAFEALAVVDNSVPDGAQLASADGHVATLSNTYT